jgi:hypothetical protein
LKRAGYTSQKSNEVITRWKCFVVIIHWLFRKQEKTLISITILRLDIFWSFQLCCGCMYLTEKSACSYNTFYKYTYFVLLKSFLVSPNTNETRIYNLFIPYKCNIFFEFRMRIKQFSFHIVLDKRNVCPESSSFVKLLWFVVLSLLRTNFCK